MNSKAKLSSDLAGTPDRAESVRTLRKIPGPPRPRTVSAPDMPPIAVEQYRRLAAILHQAQLKNGLCRLMVTSAVPGEGKTLTAVNLALTLSGSYQRKVVLMDADLRRPTTHDILGLPNVEGLNEGLKAQGPWKPPLFEVSPNLSVLTAGRPNPDPLSGITSDRMKRVLQTCADASDWLILDTPPVGLLPDAHLLAAMVDAVVFVIASGRAPHALVQRAVETLGRDRILGVVLNRVPETPLRHAYGYDAYGYYGNPQK